MDFSFEELDTGEMVILAGDGRYINAAVLDIIFMLEKQNPEFYMNWMALAENYVVVGNSVAEA